MSREYIDAHGVQCKVSYGHRSEFHYIPGDGVTTSTVSHRLDGPASTYSNGEVRWYIYGKMYTTNESFQKAANLSDDDMIVLNLKYGPIST
jgi:hypothetical protein